MTSKEQLRRLASAERHLSLVRQAHDEDRKRRALDGYCCCAMCEASMVLWRALMDVERPGWLAIPARREAAYEVSAAAAEASRA